MVTAGKYRIIFKAGIGQGCPNRFRRFGFSVPALNFKASDESNRLALLVCVGSNVRRIIQYPAIGSVGIIRRIFLFRSLSNGKEMANKGAVDPRWRHPLSATAYASLYADRLTCHYSKARDTHGETRLSQSGLGYRVVKVW